MGAGVHGGFGNTKGFQNFKYITADSSLVGNGEGQRLKDALKWVKKEPGYTDVAVHGNSEKVVYIHNGRIVELDQRRLATFLKKDSGYKGGGIRLLSCSTGKDPSGFAQNLANKLGVNVMAPSDTLHIYHSGKMSIGPNPFVNTGKWITYKPKRR